MESGSASDHVLRHRSASRVEVVDRGQPFSVSVFSSQHSKFEPVTAVAGFCLLGLSVGAGFGLGAMGNVVKALPSAYFCNKSRTYPSAVQCSVIPLWVAQNWKIFPENISWRNEFVALICPDPLILSQQHIRCLDRLN